MFQKLSRLAGSVLVASLFVVPVFSIASFGTGIEQNNASATVPTATTPAIPSDNDVYPESVSYPTEEIDSITKVYMVKDEAALNRIVKDDISYQGKMYRYVDMTVKKLGMSDEKEYTEKVRGESKSNDKTVILKSLAPTKEVETEDGYVGTLKLDEESVTTVVNSYGKSGKTSKITRTYKGLAGADMSYIPKTVTDGNVTYSLENVSWAEHTPSNPYDPDLPNEFTATVVYSGWISTSYVKDYVYEATYKGMVKLETVDGYQCSVLFVPDPVPPEPEPERYWYEPFVNKESSPAVLCLTLLLLLCLAYIISNYLRQSGTFLVVKQSDPENETEEGEE